MSGASPPLRLTPCSSSITCMSSTRTTISHPRYSIFPTSWCCGRSPRPGASPPAGSWCATSLPAPASTPRCASRCPVTLPTSSGCVRPSRGHSTPKDSSRDHTHRNRQPRHPGDVDHGHAHPRRHGQSRREDRPWFPRPRSEEHTSELQSRLHLVCRLLLEKKKKRE